MSKQEREALERAVEAVKPTTGGPTEQPDDAPTEAAESVGSRGPTD